MWRTSNRATLGTEPSAQSSLLTRQFLASNRGQTLSATPFEFHADELFPHDTPPLTLMRRVPVCDTCTQRDLYIRIDCGNNDGGIRLLLPISADDEIPDENRFGGITLAAPFCNMCVCPLLPSLNTHEQCENRIMVSVCACGVCASLRRKDRADS